MRSRLLCTSSRAAIVARASRDYGSQLTRAAGSISTNIVEGCGAPSNKEFARYLAMSIDSATETEYHLLTSRDLSLIKPNDWKKYTAETIEVRKMVYSYRVKVLSDDPMPDDSSGDPY